VLDLSTLALGIVKVLRIIHRRKKEEQNKVLKAEAMFI